MKPGDKNSWKTRPVTATPDSPLHPASKYLDYKFSHLMKYLPTYVQDSESLTKKLKNIGKLPAGEKLFTSDAVSMYTNIDTDHGLDIMNK